MAKINMPKWFVIGAVAGALNIVLLWLVSFVAPLSKYFSSVSGVDTSLGAKLVQILSGTAPFVSTVPAIVVAAIGGGLLVWFGKYIHDLPLTPDFKGETQGLIAVLIYGSLGATLILSLPGFALPTMAVLIALAINAVVTAVFIVQVLDKGLGLIDVPK